MSKPVNVVELRQFYLSALGKIAARPLRRALRDYWAEASQDHLVTLGFVLPYIESFPKNCVWDVSLMLARQGAIYWPPEGHNRTVLTRGGLLPLPNGQTNRILVIHALEYSQNPAELIKELWRILVPGGRVLLVVPNRRSLWAQAEGTPFSSGQPYSLPQLYQLVTEQGFTLVKSSTSLFAPPLQSRFFQRLAPFFECVGKIFLPHFGGVLLLEVEKQIYAAIPEPVCPPWLANPVRVTSSTVTVRRPSTSVNFSE